MQYMDDMQRRVMEDLMRQQDKIIMTSIGDLVRDGVLVLIEGPTTVFREQSTGSMRIEKSIMIRSFHQEVIDKLKAENAAIKKQLDTWRDLAQQFIVQT